MAEYIERERVLNIARGTPAYHYLKAEPTADVVEVRHGEWREETEYYADDYSECNVRKVFACSLCGRTEKTKQPYCHCGADMRGESK